MDPPIALGTVSVPFTTTRTTPVPTTPPIPGSSPNPGVATSTPASPPRPSHSGFSSNEPQKSHPSGSVRPGPNPIDPNVPASKTPATHVPAAAPTIPVTRIGGETIWRDPSRPTAIFIGDGTRPFKTIDSNSGGTVVGGVTVSLAAPAAANRVAAMPTTTIQNIPFSRLPDGRVAIDGNLILQPGQIVSYQGRTIILDGTGQSIQVNGASFPAPSSPPASIAGIPFSRLPDGTILAGDNTVLRPGSPGAHVQGKNVALSADGLSIIIDGISHALPNIPKPASTTIGGVPISVIPGTGAIIIGGTYIINPGSPPLSFQGRTISLAPNGAGVIIDGITYALPELTPASQNGGALLLIKNADGTTTTVSLDPTATDVNSAAAQLEGSSTRTSIAEGDSSSTTAPTSSRSSRVTTAVSSTSARRTVAETFAVPSPTKSKSGTVKLGRANSYLELLLAMVYVMFFTVMIGA